MTPVEQTTSRAAYDSLDPDKIIQTIETLYNRIGERFPGSGLYGVAEQLCDSAYYAQKRCAEIRRPILWVRVSSVLFSALILVLLGVTILRIGLSGETLRTLELDFLTVLESGINDVILLGAGIFFLVTLETRIKRRRSLKALHQLRSLAHVIDMHQLTKDPERVLGYGITTPSSPRTELTPYELGRYLDYCSEMLALIGKLAALYVQDFDDAVVLSSVNEIESLTTGLSRKVWQKVIILSGAMQVQSRQP